MELPRTSKPAKPWHVHLDPHEYRRPRAQCIGFHLRQTAAPKAHCDSRRAEYCRPFGICIYLAVRCSSMLRVAVVARHSYAPEARMATLGCQGTPFQDCPDFSKAATLHYLVLDTDRLRWDRPRLLRYCLNPDPSSWLARHQAPCHENPSHLSPLELRDHPADALLTLGIPPSRRLGGVGSN